MAKIGKGCFDSNETALLKTAFDEAWSQLKFMAEDEARRTELARCIVRLAMEGERDLARLRDEALSLSMRAAAWRKMSRSGPASRPLLAAPM
jgi:hypothetical protein